MLYVYVDKLNNVTHSEKYVSINTEWTLLSTHLQSQTFNNKYASIYISMMQ